MIYLSAERAAILDTLSALGFGPDELAELAEASPEALAEALDEALDERDPYGRAMAVGMDVEDFTREVKG